jgi:hypothetical protein
LEPYFSLTYFGPLEYYRELVNTQHAFWVLNDRYSKQTLRNRCSIYGANGKIQLSIPVVRTQGKNTLLKDALISYAEPWQNIHWRSIKSAYGRTPYFEHFEHKIEPVFNQNHKFLFDFLLQANLVITDIFKIPSPVLYKDSVGSDFQKALDSKSETDAYSSKDAYYQVFEDRFGFIPNLSVLDWLFHCGNKLY